MTKQEAINYLLDVELSYLDEWVEAGMWHNVRQLHFHMEDDDTISVEELDEMINNVQ